jgi:hypothetical protein
MIIVTAELLVGTPLSEILRMDTDRWLDILVAGAVLGQQRRRAALTGLSAGGGHEASTAGKGTTRGGLGVLGPYLKH